MPTHEVTNQVPPLVGHDITTFPALVEGLHREGAGWAETEVRELGAARQQRAVAERRAAGQRAPADAAHARPLRPPCRRGRVPAAVPRPDAHGRRATACTAAPGPRTAQGAHVARAAKVLGVGRHRRRAPVPDLDDLRDRARVAHDTGARRRVRAVADQPRVRLRPARPAGQARADRRHVDDREAGRLRRPREHDPRRARGRRLVPAHRPQVVHLGADVGPVPDPRAGAGRVCRASSCPACCPTARPTRSRCNGSRTSSATSRTRPARSSTTRPWAGWSATRAAASRRSSRWST